MKVYNFLAAVIGCTIAFGTMTAFDGITNADTIYIGTGKPAYSNKNGHTQNVVGTVTDADGNGLADGREGSSLANHGDVTNTRDRNWSVLYTDVFKAEYAAMIKNDKPAQVNARLSAVEYELKQQGSKAFNYVQGWIDRGSKGDSANYTGSTGSSANGVVYESSADLYGNIGMNGGGLANFAVDNAGVITTYGGLHWEELGSYRYNNDNSIDYINKNSPTSGFIGVQSSLVAFSTGFVNDATTAAYNYINGTFAVMGELLGIYLNGVLLNSDQYFISDDMISSGYEYASKYNFELNLNNVNDILTGGNNNIAFAVLGIPLEYSGITSGVASDMSFINFSAGIYQNTKSIKNNENANNTNVTPEPATLLIFGIGLAGLSLRRKFVWSKE
ncbi:MAG: PEP-CTERM sorting domain-containing protein [Planctomycetaceae bacterium]|jgi:hypothetical protein|nr:PEP-CTERM sorting domain-containing protein [Planctomycetaceae bacterium]